MKMVHAHKAEKPTQNSIEQSNQLTNDYLTVAGVPYPQFSKMNDRISKQEDFATTTDHTINDFDLSLLLRMALTKIPQIPFQYIVDKYRWNLFNGSIEMDDSNAFFWKLAINDQGIHPPDWVNRKEFFDLGAKFHVADNTPFVR